MIKAGFSFLKRIDFLILLNNSCMVLSEREFQRNKATSVMKYGKKLVIIVWEKSNVNRVLEI